MTGVTKRLRHNRTRMDNFHHEGHEEHEVKKSKNIILRNLRELRVLRGEVVFSIRRVRSDASGNLRELREFSTIVMEEERQ